MSPGEHLAQADTQSRQGKQAIQIDPRSAEAWFNQATALREAGNVDGALGCIDRALSIDPDLQAALLIGLRLCVDLNRWGQAISYADRLLLVAPGSPEVLLHRARALLGSGRTKEAVAGYEVAFAASAPSAIALNDYGAALLAEQRYAEAVCAFDSALESDPCFGYAMNNKGLALARLLRFEESLECFDRALAVWPDYVAALDNRAITLAKLGRFRESLESDEQALKIEPQFPKAHLHRGLTLLRMGEYAEGLREYEWRWMEGDMARALAEWRKFQQPLWMGQSDLRGKTILLHAEQGLGDTIQFARYAAVAAERGATVVLAVPRTLQNVLAGVDGVSRLCFWGEGVPWTDFHCPLLSMPLAVETTVETIPTRVPYIQAGPDKVLRAREALACTHRLAVGLSWRGNPSYKEDHERSISLSQLRGLLSTPRVRFISLQKDLSVEETAIADEFGMVHQGLDFDETAATVAAVDLVITVDTVWAHLAGAMGKPVWVVLASVPHWVWLADRTDSPWYPSALLFRQRSYGTWDPVIRELESRLTELARG